MTTIDRALRLITDLIVRSCDPDEVLLFGSHAKGGAGRHSDVDVLVIGNFRTSRWLRARELEGLLGQLLVHVDLHMLTPWELDVERRNPHSFLSTLKAGSTVLYRKSHAEV
jgi:predicted nucleotidyltransferase